MIKRTLLAAVAAVGLSVSSAGVMAQDVFLSFSDSAAAPTTTLTQADGSGSVFLFVDQGTSLQSIDLSAISSDTSVAQITSATILNPELPGAFGAVSNRFTNPLAQDDPAVEPGDDIVSLAAADGGSVSIVGVGSFNGDIGILGAASGVDPTFVADLNAFQVAEIAFDIVGDGTTEFSLDSTDISFLVSTSPDVFADPTLGTATLTVGAAGGPAAIPEPTSAGLLALGLVGVVARRRRR